MSGEAADDLRDEIGRLTREPPDGFVAARTARVKQLRADGHRELAGQLAAVRRPTLPAWAVDQLAHHHPDALTTLFEAAVRLRTVQAGGTSGRDQVRAATTGFTDVVRELRARAGRHLSDAGSTTVAHLDEVEATLLAAATDADVAADVRAGALVRPVPAPGFAAFAVPGGDVDAGAAAGGGNATPSTAGGADAGDDASEVVDDEVARARTERRARLERRRDELEGRRAATTPLVAEAAGAAEEARSAARTAREELATVRARLEQLEERIASLEADAAAADGRREAAARELARVTDELARLVDDLDG